VKDELTLPTKVVFEFGMVPFHSGNIYSSTKNSDPSPYLAPDPAQDPPIPNQYKIDKGVLIIEAIEFDGRRTQGEDIYFMSDLPDKIVSTLDKELTNIGVTFDIPQGEYNRIEVTLHMGVDSSLPFVLEGDFSLNPFTTIPIRFEYAFADRVTIRAKPKTGNNIILRKDTPTTARVMVDTGFMFRLINPGIIATADLVRVSEEDVVLINSSHNVNIFNQVANRFHNSISVVFE